MGRTTHFRGLDAYRMAMAAAVHIFEISKRFPVEERYSLTDQVRRKRRYPNAFASKLSDAEAEAAETEVWLEMAVRCGYL